MDYMDIEVNKDGIWEEAEIQDLEEGDVFRMFDPKTGKQFIGDNDTTEWRVIGEPYLNTDGIWTVDVEDP